MKAESPEPDNETKSYGKYDNYSISSFEQAKLQSINCLEL